MVCEMYCSPLGFDYYCQQSVSWFQPPATSATLPFHHIMAMLVSLSEFRIHENIFYLFFCYKNPPLTSLA